MLKAARSALCQLFLLLLSYLPVFCGALLVIIQNKVINRTIIGEIEQKVKNVYRKNRPVPPPVSAAQKRGGRLPKIFFLIFFLPQMLTILTLFLE